MNQTLPGRGEVETAAQRTRSSARRDDLDASGSLQVQLPPLPSTFTEVLQLVSEGEAVPDTRRLVEVLKRDPIASAWVIRRINSARYGLASPVPSVEHAVALLGFEPLCHTLLAEVLTQTFPRFHSLKAGRVYDHLLSVSLAAAVIAQALATRLGIPRRKSAFSAGLLHQLGRLLLLSADPDRYVELWRDVIAEGGGVFAWVDPEAERRAFGSDYARIGAEAARTWNLPEHLVAAIKYHPDPRWAPKKRYRVLALTVAAANASAVAMYETSRTSSNAERPPGGDSAALEELAMLRRIPPESLRSFVGEQERCARKLVQTMIAAI